MDFELSPTCQIKNLKELYRKYFNNHNLGTFVEVGASDGYSHSNTWGLAEAGWKGIYFEPVPSLAEECRKRHEKNDVIVVNKAIGDKQGLTKLYLGEFPTINEETVARNPWDSPYDPNNFMYIQVDTLDNELDLFLPALTEIDLLVIDVEGGELEVLNGFDLLSFMPTMIIIESCEGNPDTRKTFHTQEILAYFEETPYTKIQSDGINSIFVHDSYLESNYGI